MSEKNKKARGRPALSEAEKEARRLAKESEPKGKPGRPKKEKRGRPKKKPEPKKKGRPLSSPVNQKFNDLYRTGGKEKATKRITSKIVKQIAEEQTSFARLAEVISDDSILGKAGFKVLKACVSEDEFFSEQSELEITMKLFMRRIQIELLDKEGDLSKAQRALEFVFDRIWGKVKTADDTSEKQQNEQALLENIQQIQNNYNNYSVEVIEGESKDVDTEARTGDNSIKET